MIEVIVAIVFRTFDEKKCRKYDKTLFLHIFMLFQICTGCNSDIWKKGQVNILKETLLVLKQMISQQKALDLSFNLTP